MRTEGNPIAGWLGRGMKQKALLAASLASILAAGVVVAVATSMVVRADTEAELASIEAVIPEDTTSEQSPELVDEVVEPPVIGDARGPLSNSEVAYARHLASEDPAYPAEGDSNVAYLATTVAEFGAHDDGARRFDVTYYDYGQNAVLRFVVNLTTQEVELAESATGLQPPPSDSETFAAFELLIEDPQSATIRAAFEGSAGEPLTSPEQAVYVGSSFISSPGTIGAEECGVDRCVMLLIQTPDGAYLPTTHLVVNLSQQSVLEIN